MDQDEIQLLLDQARITLGKGRMREAEKFLEKVLSVQPDNDQALNLKGLLLFKEDRFAEAVGIFRKLLDLFPDEPTLRTNLGLALLKSEQLVEAEVELKSALAAGGNKEKINNYLGLVMSGLGKYQDAQDYFEAGGSKKMAEQMLSLLGGDEEKETLPEPAQTKPVEEEVADVLENSVSQAEYEPDLDTTLGGDDPDEAGTTVPVPELQALGGKADIFSAAMLALNERFGGVVETQNLGDNLQKLAELLSVQKQPDHDFETPQPNVVRVNVSNDPVYARSANIVSQSGQLESRVQNKKYKGKELSTPFGDPENPIHRIDGNGMVLLEAEGRWFHIIPLEEELIYIIEPAIAGFLGELRFENGRLPSDGGDDVDLVQFRGKGRILLATNEKLLAVPITGDDRCSVTYERVVGWFGNTVPTVAANRPPFHESNSKLIAFKGEGIVLLSCKAP
jgi:uncharacterized protein (AIM24 family)